MIDEIPTLIRSWATRRSFYRDLRMWLERAQTPDLELPSKRVLFNTARCSRSTSHLYTDLLLGRLLAQNGASAVILLDDGVLEHWDTVQAYRTRQQILNPMRSTLRKAVIKSQIRWLWRLFAVKGMELIWYSDCQVSDAAALDHHDCELIPFARASTIRFFEGRLDLTDPMHAAYYKKSLRNARVSRAIGEYAVETVRPDVFATSHGVYSAWGPAYKHVKEHGVPALVYMLHPYIPQGLMIDDAPAGALNHTRLDAFLRTATFTDEARATALAYMDSRFQHRASDTSEYFAAPTKKDRIVQLIANSDRYECTFGLFPNVVWDAIGENIEAIYDSVIAWIVDSARTIGEHGRHRLVIRFHPAEHTRLRGTLATDRMLRDAMPEIDGYPNVELVGSHEAVDSYTLLRDVIDVALVYSGTLGAEAQLLDVPVIAVAAGRFSRQIVMVAADAAAYRALLRDPAPIQQDFKERRDGIHDDVLKYHFYVNDVLYFPVGLLSRYGRRVMQSEELRDHATLDQREMAKTLRRFVPTPENA